MRFVIRLFASVKQRDENERAALLRHPWAFREVVSAEHTTADAMQANALLHLLFPDEFSAVVSGRHRATLLKVFAGAPGVDPVENDDRQIEQIRALVDEQLGRSLDFYDRRSRASGATRAIQAGRSSSTGPAGCTRSRSSTSTSTTTSSGIAERMASAREAFERDAAEWQHLLRSAVRYSRQNLVDFRVHGTFLDWVAAEPGRAATALRATWADDDVRTRMRGFLEAIRDQPLGGPSARLSMGALLMLGRRPENVAPYQVDGLRRRAQGARAPVASSYPARTPVIHASPSSPPPPSTRTFGGLPSKGAIKAPPGGCFRSASQGAERRDPHAGDRDPRRDADGRGAAACGSSSSIPASMPSQSTWMSGAVS